MSQATTAAVLLPSFALQLHEQFGVADVWRVGISVGVDPKSGTRSEGRRHSRFARYDFEIRPFIFDRPVLTAVVPANDVEDGGHEYLICG